MIATANIADPGKGKPPKEAESERIKAWRAPKEGDTNPKTGNPYTKSTATKARNDLRSEREAAWLSS